MIKIEYDGEYPCLCFGQLIVTIENTKWEFPQHCLGSGGSVYFDDDWEDHVEEGPWTITKWPKGFPEDKKEDVANAVNEYLPWGCCGGCV
jgi:hypothetical protein